MRSVTLVVFCVFCSISLVSSKYPIKYKILRTGEDGDEAIDDDASGDVDIGVDDDADIVTLSGDNDRDDGVDDDDDGINDSGEAKKLSKGNDVADADDEIDLGGDKGVADDDENDGVDDGEGGVADGDVSGVADGEKSDGSDGLHGHNNKVSGLLPEDEPTAIHDSVEDEVNQGVEDDELLTKKKHKHGPKLDLSSEDMALQKQYEKELEAGDWGEFMGNSHYDDAKYYKDLSRRFVPIYPYWKRKVKHSKHKHRKPRKPSPEQIIQYLMSSKRILRNSDANEDRDIVPIEAPRDVVVAVMKNATQKYASNPSESTEEVIRSRMLRSGDYWDSVYTEDGNYVKKPVLRTSNKKHKKQKLDMEPFTSELVPGTKLYDLLSRIVKKSPKLLYFINK